MGTEGTYNWVSGGITAVAVIGALVFSWRTCSDRSGAGRGIPRAAEQQGIGTDRDAASLGSPSAPSTSLSSTAGASSSPSGPGTPTAEKTLGVELSTDGGSEGEPPGVDYEALSRIYDYYDETPEDSALAVTLDIWEDPNFKAFVGDRVASYPTKEDVRLALENGGVQRALWDYLVASGVASEFALTLDVPKDVRVNAQKASDTAQMDLYRALDKGSAYHEWETLGKLWRAYDE